MRLLVLLSLATVLAGSTYAEAVAVEPHRSFHRHGAAPGHGSAQRPGSTYSESHIQQLPDSVRVPAGPVPKDADPSGNAAHTSPVTCDAQNASSPACYAATQQAHPVGR